jgi:glycosyltransferase involved in cell wall biosynthesis
MTASRRPRVLMLVENISYTHDTRVRVLAGSLWRAGYDVSVVCPRLPGDPRRAVIDGVAVRFFRYRDLGGFGFLGHVLEYAYSGARLGGIALWRTIRGQVDVVHLCVPPHVFFPIGLAVRRLGARLVVDQHDLMPELFAVRYGSNQRLMLSALRRAERAALRGADHVLVTNRLAARIALSRAGVPPARVSIVLTCPEVSARVREHSAAGATPITVGYVGNMQRQDGVSLLIEAAHAVRYVLGRRDVRFVCIGDGADLGRLHALAERLGLAEIVEFTGRLSHEEAIRRLATCDICVQPDPRNVFSETCTMLKTLEYMALGKPVVAFDLPATMAACGDAALYATGNASDQLARLIDRLASDPGLRKRLGRAGRRRIDDRLGWRHAEPVLLRVYRGLAPVPDSEQSTGEDVEDVPVETLGHRQPSRV